MNLTLLGAVVCLALWVLLTFVFPLGASVVHVFLIAAALLFTRRVLLGRTRI